MMIATCGFSDENAGTVGALESIGNSQGGSSGVVALFVSEQIGWFIESGITLLTLMGQLAEMIEDVQFKGVPVGEYFLAMVTGHGFRKGRKHLLSKGLLVGMVMSYVYCSGCFGHQLPGAVGTREANLLFTIFII